MKKLLLLLLICPFILGSCSSDDDETDPSLKSTVWKGTQDNIDIVITFSEFESTMVLSSPLSSSITKSAAYTYTYEHPKVTMYPKEDGNARMEGTVSDDHKTMVMVNTSSGKTIGTLTKK